MEFVANTHNHYSTIIPFFNSLEKRKIVERYEALYQFIPGPEG